MTRKTLGKYEIIERIGRGGMAEVYRGYHAALDRYVAIKLLHPFLADDPEFKDRFEKEAKNVARLRHPNIVQVFDFDFDEQGESYYMVMELVNGSTLKDRLFDQATSTQRFPLAETTRIIADTANALAYAHKRKMIHRDVKPANLMLDEDERVVLTDFGIAKIVTGGQFTASGGMVGTPAYMAPEQGLGEAGDERSDIYSLGVILYQMLTGRLPFDADTPLAIILKHVNEPLPDPRTFEASLPDWIVNVVNHALKKEPDERFQTADEMLEALSQRQSKHANKAPRVPTKQETLLSQVDKETEKSTVARKPSTVLDPSRRQATTTTATERIPGVVNTAPSRPTPPGSQPPRPSSPPGPAQSAPRKPQAQAKRGQGGRLLAGIAGIIFLASIVLLGLIVAGQGGDGPLASLFDDDDGNGESGNPITRVQETETAVAALATLATAKTQVPEVTESPTATGTPTATTSPSPSPSPTTTPTATNTRTSTPTQSPSPTNTPSPTPNLAQTERANLQATQTAAAIATAAAVTPTLTQQQIIENCDLGYAILTPDQLNIAPAFADAANPRIVRVRNNFTITLTIENASNCNWPEEGGLQLVFVEEVEDLEVDYEPLTRNCTTPINEGSRNLTRENRPRIFIEGDGDIARGETTEIQFEGRAPDVRGCYFSFWQLEFADYGGIKVGDPFIIAIQSFGS
ncbi:MAG: protein kinase [Chloroflexi bacterium]|nr:protein kinase [Chloroflexota bacterium]